MAAFFVSVSEAQTVCGSRAKFLQNLAQRYGEYPVAIGLGSNGQLLEVLTSENGSWTIIITDHHGKTCMVTSGEAWEIVDTEKGPKT